MPWKPISESQNIMHHIIKTSMLALAVMFVSCGKKWKETTSVDVHFLMTYNSTGILEISSCTMAVGELDFSGKRKKGGDVSFSDVESTPLLLNLKNGAIQSADHYDIPQGEYTSINMVVKAVSQNTAPGISLSGIFTDYTHDSLEEQDELKKEMIPVLFEFNTGQNFNINTTAANGSNQIVLIEGTPATCEISFDPYYWLATITKKQLEDAAKYTINGVKTIVINETQNQDLYALIVARINQTATAVFK